jgi:hypothetical protein
MSGTRSTFWTIFKHRNVTIKGKNKMGIKLEWREGSYGIRVRCRITFAVGFILFDFARAT